MTENGFKTTWPNDKDRYRFFCNGEFIYASTMPQAKKIFAKKGINGVVYYDYCYIDYSLEDRFGNITDRITLPFKRNNKFSPLQVVNSRAWSDRDSFRVNLYLVKGSTKFRYSTVASSDWKGWQV